MPGRPRDVLWLVLGSVSVVTLVATATRAEVLEVEISSREAVRGGQSFGTVGPYERLDGEILFGFDPTREANARIVDLDLAPVNEQGLVEARANLVVLRPVEGGSGTALLEVSNRGGKASLRYFNGSGRDPYGDGFLMRRGLTVIWVGWQYDVPLGGDRMRLEVPHATAGTATITGLVRSDWTVDRPTEALALGHRNHQAYPVLDPAGEDCVLTVRDGRLAPRRVLERDTFSFARLQDGARLPDPTWVHLEGGFQAGRIYELVYRAQDPAIVGLGLAAIRDTMSFAKYDEDCPFAVERGLAIGISQTGRFLRHFLYQGFNTDEDGRKVYDGLLVHTAGAGRGSFNHRFAQPSRDAHRYSAFFYPTDLFPFSGRPQEDPVTGRREGLLDLARESGHLPKIFFTNTGYEYWGRAASLLHTTVDGSADVDPLPEVRIYHLAGTQHFPVGFPPGERQRLPGAAAAPPTVRAGRTAW